MRAAWEGTLFPRLPALLGEFTSTEAFVSIIRGVLRGPCQIWKKDKENSKIASCILNHSPELSTNMKNDTSKVHTNVTNLAICALLPIPDRESNWSVDLLATPSGRGPQCELEIQRNHNQVWVGCICIWEYFVFWITVAIRFGWDSPLTVEEELGVEMEVDF